MSKSIAIIDTPEGCYLGCPFKQGDYCVGTLKNVSGHFHTRTKPEWCPLRPIPEKKDMEFLDDKSEYYRQGWNACIDSLFNSEGT